MATSSPETYFLSPTSHVPNSRLPVLVYRQVLSPDHKTATTAESVRALIEKNHWLQGGIWKAIKTHHFHSVTHECYAVFKGKSGLLLGKGPLDSEDAGVEIDVEAGDTVVLPAGVSHCSLNSEGDYSYVGLYPEGSPHWDNNWCKARQEETAEKANNARAVPIPNYDPIFGRDGPLVQIWNRAAASVEQESALSPG